MSTSTPKGTFDLLPLSGKEEPWKNIAYWHYVEELIRSLAREFSFSEIRTPIFEATELFLRGVGEETDIVGKEMYTFLDKGGRSLTLRPENTAAVMRAIIEKRLYETPSCRKLFYLGPMFRHERPQAGRYRQHHQFGAEAIGVKSARQDVEMIDMLWQLLSRLGLKNLRLLVNSVGDSASREKYKEALCDFLMPHKESLSPESQVRLVKNPLRILDTKSPAEQKLLKGAPHLQDYLSAETEEHFAEVKTLLEQFEIPFTVTPTLVRGLDYYEKTVFEVVSGELGAQNTVGAGGRYDGLIHRLGGPDLPAVGFATGLERLLQTVLLQGIALPEAEGPFLYLIPLGEEAARRLFLLAHELRIKRISVEVAKEEKKLKTHLQQAEALGARYVLILGEEEIGKGAAVLKEMKSRTEEPIPLSSIVNRIVTLHAV